MKFSQATLVAILASSAVVGAAPVANIPQGTEIMIKRSEANDILTILSEIKSIHAKRELIDETHEDWEVLEKRASGALSELISALGSSGIVSTLWNTLTTDPTIKSSLSSILSSVLQSVVSAGPQLISGIWNSGLLGDLWTDVTNSPQLVSALEDAGSELLSWVVGLFGGSSSSTTTTAKRSIEDYLADTNTSEFLDKRDTSQFIIDVYNDIKDSGVVQGYISDALANPTQTLSTLGKYASEGFSALKTIYTYLNDQGDIASIINSLPSSLNSGIIGSIIKLLEGVLGVKTSPSSGTPTTTAAAAGTTAKPAVTTTATTATTTKAAAAAAASSAPAAAAAAAVQAPAAAAAAAPAATAAAASAAQPTVPSDNNNPVYASLAAEFGGQKRRRNY